MFANSGEIQLQIQAPHSFSTLRSLNNWPSVTDFSLVVGREAAQLALGSHVTSWQDVETARGGKLMEKT